MKYTFLLCCLLTGIATSAQTWQDTAKLIDNLLDRYTSNHPGAQLAISRHGEIIYTSARGLANLEYNAPLTTQSKIEAGSVSKQFTAASILLLEQQGKLSLQDDIRKYVPEIRDYGPTITIGHLMHHTSGLKDWGSIAEIAGWQRGTKAYDNNDALHIISLQKTLNNKPGDEFIYSNSNYNLMAIIVQRVSGMSLAEFSAKNIFEPAGMTNTSWRDNYKRVVPGRATAYSKGNTLYSTNMPNENAYGNGGLLTTAEDLLRWNQYYLQGKLGSPSLLAKQTATPALNDGHNNNYAAGLFIDVLNGQPCITHNGATAGYRANLDYFPQLDLSIAWLSNTAESLMGTTPTLVRNLLVKSTGAKRTGTGRPAEEKIDTTQKPTEFQPYFGTYYSEEAEAYLYIAIKDGKLQAWQRPGLEEVLTPYGKDAFTFPGGVIRFEKSGKRMKLYISIPRARNVLFEQK